MYHIFDIKPGITKFMYDEDHGAEIELKLVPTEILGACFELTDAVSDPENWNGCDFFGCRDFCWETELIWPDEVTDIIEGCLDRVVKDMVSAELSCLFPSVSEWERYCNY